MRKSAKEWEEKYNTAISESNQKIADMAFDHALESAISGAKGKNAKAIRALLDVDALKGSKNQEADIKTALEALKRTTAICLMTGATLPLMPVEQEREKISPTGNRRALPVHSGQSTN